MADRQNLSCPDALRRAQSLESQLVASLKKGKDPLDTATLRLSEEIRALSKSIIASDIIFAQSHDVCQILWTGGCYRVIERCRLDLGSISSFISAGKSAEQKAEHDAKLKAFQTSVGQHIKQCCGFLDELLVSVVQDYRLPVPCRAPFTVSEEHGGKKSKGANKLAVNGALVSFRILVFLGDLSRYWLQLVPMSFDLTEFVHVSNAAQDVSYFRFPSIKEKSEARDKLETIVPVKRLASHRVYVPEAWLAAIWWYDKALTISPWCGLPWNQLALLSHAADDELHEVYYYLRCLGSAVPFASARENLILLFEQNRQRLNDFSAARAVTLLSSATAALALDTTTTVHGLPTHPTLAADPELTVDEVRSLFLLRFVCLVGMIFSQVRYVLIRCLSSPSLEHFDSLRILCMRSFEKVLKLRLLDDDALFKCTAVLLFVADPYAHVHTSGSLGEGERRVVAIQHSVSMLVHQWLGVMAGHIAREVGSADTCSGENSPKNEYVTALIRVLPVDRAAPTSLESQLLAKYAHFCLPAFALGLLWYVNQSGLFEQETSEGSPVRGTKMFTTDLVKFLRYFSEKVAAALTAMKVDQASAHETLILPEDVQAIEFSPFREILAQWYPSQMLVPMSIRTEGTRKMVAGTPSTLQTVPQAIPHSSFAALMARRSRLRFAALELLNAPNLEAVRLAAAPAIADADIMTVGWVDPCVWRCANAVPGESALEKLDEEPSPPPQNAPEAPAVQGQYGRRRGRERDRGRDKAPRERGSPKKTVVYEPPQPTAPLSAPVSTPAPHAKAEPAVQVMQERENPKTQVVKGTEPCSDLAPQKLEGGHGKRWSDLVDDEDEDVTTASKSTTFYKPSAPVLKPSPKSSPKVQSQPQPAAAAPRSLEFFASGFGGWDMFADGWNAKAGTHPLFQQAHPDPFRPSSLYPLVPIGQPNSQEQGVLPTYPPVGVHRAAAGNAQPPQDQSPGSQRSREMEQDDIYQSQHHNMLNLIDSFS